jgi:hypothetical protein
MISDENVESYILALTRRCSPNSSIPGKGTAFGSWYFGGSDAAMLWRGVALWNNAELKGDSQLFEASLRSVIERLRDERLRDEGLLSVRLSFSQAEPLSPSRE